MSEKVEEKKAKLDREMEINYVIHDACDLKTHWILLSAEEMKTSKKHQICVHQWEQCKMPYYHMVSII